jgi:alkylation response protein AidB-like acyl-CoA dehydrogenase
MQMALSSEQVAFRDECRQWLADNRPAPLPDDEEARFRERVAWQRRLQADRWAAVDWPEEVGGRGASTTEAALFFGEMARADAPLPANEIGLQLTGPTLMACGSDEQQQRFLPTILSAEEIWCQGFSEPGAGSDLAAVSTRAVADGDHWVVTGQKLWTSFAQHADWCILLARTSDEPGPRHRGLTFFLLDMRQPGVTVRPIRQMTGECEFNEVFLDRVPVHAQHVVGEVGDGWRVAMRTLMTERSGLGFYFQMTLRKRLDDLIGLAAERGALDDPRIEAAIGALHVRVETLSALAWRGVSHTERHGHPGPESSVSKWMWSEAEQQLERLSLDVLGTDAIMTGSPWAFQLLRGPGYTIEGGTTQIQKNIIAQRVLGLPRAV